ncbi:MAG: hypothetical protein ACI4M0_04705 [Christensenellales bacterium]
MEKKSLTFIVSKKIADMFSLSTALMDKDENEVFEELVKRYATETLQRMNAETCDTPKESDFIPPTPTNYSAYREPSCKAEKKIPLWARRLNQINAQIIRAYFYTEQDGIASRRKMREFFLQSNPDKSLPQFECNLSSMCTDKSNAHGHIFDCYGDEVHIANVAHDILLAHKEMFMR